MKSGFVTIIGRPNVGKSTLLNAILKQKVAIVSNKPQTTRNIIQGVYNDSESQIVFIDTPGIHKPKNKLGNLLNKKSYSMAQEVDLVIFMTDASLPFGKGDKFIIERLKNEESPKAFLLLNKIDKIKKESLLEKIDNYKDLYDFKEIIPISALKDKNVNTLIENIKKYLNEGEKYFDDDYLTNQTPSFVISERVREKILELTKDEVPHTVTCLVEEFTEEEKIIDIQVLIVVDRENLKKIIIGKNGQMLKEIGTRARLDLEEHFQKKIFLSLYVKVIESWRDKEKYLKDLGLKDDIGDV